MDDRTEKPLVLTVQRVLIAMLLAAGLAAGLTALDYGLSRYNSPHWDRVAPYAWANVTYIYGLSFIGWLVGMAFFGGPVWHVMHLSGLRKWHHAMLAGFCVPFVVLLASRTGFFTGLASGGLSLYANGGQQWVNGRITVFGWLMALQSSATVGGVGAVLGLVIWRTAYRRS